MNSAPYVAAEDSCSSFPILPAGPSWYTGIVGPCVVVVTVWVWSVTRGGGLGWCSLCRVLCQSGVVTISSITRAQTFLTVQSASLTRVFLRNSIVKQHEHEHFISPILTIVTPA